MLSLDHIVIASSDLEKASKKYEETFDIKTVKGGEHESWGTYNYLAYFSNDSYIEWLGSSKTAIARNSDNPLIQHLVYLLGRGLQEPYQLALQTCNLDGFVEHFQSEKIPFIGPVPGKRKRPDGKMITWRMLFPTYNFKTETLPFLIEWDQPKEERIDVSLVNNQ